MDKDAIKTAGSGAPAADNPDLNSLQGDAARVDAAADPQPEPPPAGADVPPAGEAAREGVHSISTVQLVQGVLLGSGNLLAMRYPAVKRVYTEERCGMVGAALAPVLDRWGITAKDSVAMQYVVAIGALVMLGMDTVEVIKGSTHENTAGRAHPGGPAPKPVP